MTKIFDATLRDTYDQYLAACSVVTCNELKVQERACALVEQLDQRDDQARRCFEWVRDEVAHTCDAKRGPVTCSAGAVLEHGVGLCYAKSHLLCALLRALKIPAGLCYQRLSVSDAGGCPYSLHGLVAVELANGSWYRIDPRGNRAGNAGGIAVDAQWDPPREQLAFAFHDDVEEYDLPGIYARPLPKVVQALQDHDDWRVLIACLPDVSSGAR